MELLNIYRAYRKYLIEKKKSKPYQIKFFNFWAQEMSEIWFAKFIHSRGLLDKYPKKKISFFSVFGARYVFDWNKSDIKIFFTGENLQKHFPEYSDSALSNAKINLSLGFEYLSNNPKYLRFPLWILFTHDPEYREKEIIEATQKLSHPIIRKRSQFASHISSWDGTGIRREICEALTKIEKVDCAGKFMHNDDSLRLKYNDNKITYLKNYKFNICPENSDSNGYVTEKIFQSIQAGCIPVYWGSENNPEPDILNQEAIIFWEKGGENEKVISLIAELNQSSSKLNDFISQPRLTKNAPELIITMFDNLEKKLKDVIHFSKCTTS